MTILKSMRKLIAALLLTIGIPSSAAAQEGTIFYWVDKKGNVTATQNLDEVPEPYRAMYRARLKELEEEKKKQKSAATPEPSAPAPLPQTPPGGSIVDRELQRQKQWKAEVAQWRTELRLATIEAQQAQNDVDAAALNPILRQTPQGQAQMVEPAKRKQEAIARVERAKNMLEVELPKRAKAENVPPAWLL